MSARQVVIVGAGLSGLYAAYLLQKAGIDYVILEARRLTGGRILAALVDPDSASGGHNRFDLGPTWFWPDYQTDLNRLVEGLGLKTFDQFETGDTLVEQAAAQPVRRVAGYLNSPTSVRVAGSMQSLVQALQDLLDPDRILTGQKVRRIRQLGDTVELESEGGVSRLITTAQQVLLAAPPRLVQATIDFDPPLPAELALQWISTPTWMAPHAKYIAVYEHPFWRKMNLSGQARSAVGPMVEIHDASAAGGSAALFGFIGVPAQTRRGIPDLTMKAYCRAQLARLFGEMAQTPEAEFLKDWAQDVHTATDADLAQHNHAHAPAPPVRPENGPWKNCVIGVASEWSPDYPGYLAGAVDAASRGVSELAASDR